MNEAQLIAAGLAWAVLAAIVQALWFRQRKTGNAGVIDPAWTAGVGGVGVLLAALGDGWGPRRWLAAALIGLWSGRLLSHLLQRMRREGSEDGRYAQMRKAKGEGFDAWLLPFFHVQALLAVLLAAVVALAANAPDPSWGVTDVLAVLFWVISITGEAIADRQLERFRSDPSNKGRTCREGLWRFSRHPNYFFEWLHWFAYPLLAWGTPWGWLAWLAPAGMLLLVVKVTGIPPTERRALESRPEDYRRYQCTTNAFFPGPPRPEEQCA